MQISCELNIIRIILILLIMENCQCKSNSQKYLSTELDFEDKIKQQLSREEPNHIQQSYLFQPRSLDPRISHGKIARNFKISTQGNIIFDNLASHNTSNADSKNLFQRKAKLRKQNRRSCGDSDKIIVNQNTKSYGESCKNLKARLRQLLENQNLETAASEEPSPMKSHKKMLSKSQHSPFFQSCKRYPKRESKTILLKLGIPESQKQFTSTKYKEGLMTKFSDKFPRINKKSQTQQVKMFEKIQNSEKTQACLRTRYQNPDRTSQIYLEPVNTDRNEKPPYKLTFQSLQPLKDIPPSQQSSQQDKLFKDSHIERENRQILLKLAKNIKFK